MVTVHARAHSRVLSTSTIMSLHRYFDKKDVLPNPKSSLSKVIPSSSIAAANNEVRPLMKQGTKGKRGPYSKFSPEQKAVIGKRAEGCDWQESSRMWSWGSCIKIFPCLKENTVRDWRDLYLKELKKKWTAASVDITNSGETKVTHLTGKRRGHPLLLGEELDKEVQEYLLFLRERGAVVNTSIVVGCAEGIVRNTDSNLLASNGGHILITKYWAKRLLVRMGFVKRKASTKAKVSLDDVIVKKEQFLLDIRAVVVLEDIPLDLIVNWTRPVYTTSLFPPGRWQWKGRRGLK